MEAMSLFDQRIDLSFWPTITQSAVCAKPGRHALITARGRKQSEREEREALALF